MSRLARHLDAPTLIALLALFVALGGSAYALKKGSVGSKELAKNAVKSKHIKNRQIKPKDIKNAGLKGKSLADGAAGGDALADGSLTSPKLADGGFSGDDLSDGAVTESKLDFATFIGDSLVKAAPSASDNDPATARAAASKVPLFSGGPLSIYGKCYEDADDDNVYVGVFIETSVDRVIVSGLAVYLPGGAAPQFLNTGTAEADSILLTTAVGADGAAIMPFPGSDFPVRAAAPDGTTLYGRPFAAAKNGTLFDGNFIYGAGDVCLFGGEVFS